MTENKNLQTQSICIENSMAIINLDGTWNEKLTG